MHKHDIQRFLELKKNQKGRTTKFFEGNQIHGPFFEGLVYAK